MNLRNTLSRLVRVVIEEAERNPKFEAALVEAMADPSAKRKPSKSDDASPPLPDTESKRGKNRRDAAALDPVQVVREGEVALRAALGLLSLEQLRDIVSEYGMDQGRLVMKWATPERVVDRIVEMSVARARKGNAFRKTADEVPPASAMGANELSEPVKNTDEASPATPMPPSTSS